jgi:cysteine desulfurase
MYFDNNATALSDPRIAHALMLALEKPLGNPSSHHGYGQSSKAILSEARRQIASYLNVKQSQIIFTSGGSEGAFLSIRGIVKSPSGAHIISSEIEHACVYETLELLKAEGAKVTYLPVGLTGAVDPKDLEAAITPSTTAIVLMAANNETGVKQDIASFSAIAERNRIPLIVDGVSLIGKDKVIIPSGVSAMFFSGHKIHALQGVGFLYLKNGLKFKPQITGGSQEFGMRGGTENMLGIISLSKAIHILKEEGESSILHMAAMRDRLEKALLQLPHVKINGTAPRICNTTSLSFGTQDGESLLIALDQAGIAVSLGSACSSGAIEPSRILLKMGVPLSEARASIRFSFSRLNTMAEIDQALTIIEQLYKQ